jgi:A/G-specific adenine glycosylase
MLPPGSKASPSAARREALLAWFRSNDPGYPWRLTERDPYAVLVSEMMLQQTQASRAAAAFPVFMRRFPDVETLAASTSADVVRAWSGLGYNRRAVALHRAARTIVDEHGGIVPSDPDRLRALPGVGPYTAAAVASIAYRVPVAAIDTNVRRVMARLALGVEPVGAAPGDVAAVATSWLDPRAPGDWNQAVMNLGRDVCRPVPRCGACPLAAACRSRAIGHSGAPSGRRADGDPAPYEGSMRQVRGAIVRALTARQGPVEIRTISAAIERPESTVRQAVPSLERDGLIRVTRRGRLGLPDR